MLTFDHFFNLSRGQEEWEDCMEPVKSVLWSNYREMFVPFCALFFLHEAKVDNKCTLLGIERSLIY